MAMKKCKECGELISGKAKNCPKCGRPNETPRLILLAVILLLPVGAIWSVWDVPPTQSVSEQIKNKILNDMIAEYNLAKSQGYQGDMCAGAETLSSHYLQANDSPNYNKWKTIEKYACGE